MTCGVCIAATGSYRGRKVVRRAASCVLFDCDVYKFVTSRDTFQVCTGVMPTAKTRGMRSCTCHDLLFRVMICHVVWKRYHWTNKVCEVSWKIATCNAVRRSTVALFEVGSVPRGSCFVLAHRWKGKLYVCSLFLSGFDTDDLCSLASVRHV